jgi:tRNA (adenine57-N1/adenine58-N1)-methyltransferase catalytic subunit
MIMKIQEGSYVLLFHTARKKWLTQASVDKKLHTHLGVIDISQIIGMEYGSEIKTTGGDKIYLVEPTIYDFIMKSKRKTQIVYPKDFGFVAARVGLKNGCHVLEVGTGSGALTTFAASIVKPNGHIHTFDINAEFMKIAKENLEKAGMYPYVTMHEYDASEGFPVENMDVAIIDLGDPWTVIDQIHHCLKGSGSFVAICPTVNQIERTATELKQKGFLDIECTELMIRTMEAREGMTRPAMRMIGHTTYLVFARKCLG